MSPSRRPESNAFPMSSPPRYMSAMVINLATREQSDPMHLLLDRDNDPWGAGRIAIRLLRAEGWSDQQICQRAVQINNLWHDRRYEELPPRLTMPTDVHREVGTETISYATLAPGIPMPREELARWAAHLLTDMAGYDWHGEPDGSLCPSNLSPEEETEYRRQYELCNDPDAVSIPVEWSPDLHERIARGDFDHLLRDTTKNTEP